MRPKLRIPISESVKATDERFSTIGNVEVLAGASGNGVVPPLAGEIASGTGVVPPIADGVTPPSGKMGKRNGTR